ncbi:MAG TPA: PSD1 and planctomycete cytochrome C domain-containing protein [Pirellulaceae bacterium]|nr:PSD1 and planctomycete cytochrome C domain-containing protein [Pirellulaceae bacterium]HMO91910.1 PSD1 and planctomycete cytochrome C domain-containing protein [Pirellulaceae bacterium]HMP68710.1 PSD1 and planctomycete cytochrome C domain-containing protein [Pirellulaceae bacterium]
MLYARRLRFTDYGFLKFFVPIAFFGAVLWSGRLGHAQEEQESATNPEFTEQQIEFFENRIRPILVERCFECHSHQAEYAEGSLYLDSREAILQGGDSGPAIELDDIEESLFIDAINYGSLFKMPPASKMPTEEIELLTQWIEMGMPWPSESKSANVARSFDLVSMKAEHWCWHPPQRITPPETLDRDWPGSPIDQFILHKLEQANLQPAQQASRQELIRRAYFDLIGLPPTPEQVGDFVNDPSPNAFQKVIDSLLASPRFGEHWARHWMDLVRYAETYGHEYDYPIENAFRYRDYLIRAFNEDVPYDQFIKEHVAGDLLHQPRLHPQQSFNESILGTGFWFLGEATHGPVDSKGDEAGRIDNQIDILCKTFLGLTVACARCHDHKFDAISTEDYYALSGFLQSSRRQDVLLDADRKIESSFNEIAKIVDNADNVASELFADFRSSDPRDLTPILCATIEAIANDPRLLNNETIHIEAENMVTVARDGGTIFQQEIAPQDGTHWSGNKQLWWFEGKLGDEFVVEFEVPYAGHFAILGDFTKAVDYGVCRVSLNDRVLVEELDLYSKVLSKTGEISLGEIELSAGKQQLKIKSIGTNPDAVPKYMFGLDYLTFVPVATESQAEVKSALEEIAARYQVETQLLLSWIQGLKDTSVGQPAHPMFVIRQLGIELGRQSSRDFKQAAAAVQVILDEHWRAAEKSREGAELFADFSPSNYDAWFETGFAFGGAATENVVAADGDNRALLPGGLAHSGRFGKRMYGVLRSPTFEIRHPHIHYRMLAQDARVRLIIDGFVLDVHNPLLFNGMTFRFSSEGNFVWRTQADDLKNYIGHKAHIEIIDHGDGFACVDEIWFSDSAAPTDYPSKIALSSTQRTANSLHEFCENFVRECFFQRDEQTLINDQVILFNWLYTHRLAGDRLATHLTKLTEFNEQIATVQNSTPRPIMAIGMTDGSPKNEYVFIRGNHKNIGREVPRDIPWSLRSQPDEILFDRDSGSGRFYLAEQIASNENPLTSRVIVNRIWHHLFGRGIVSSVDNFGVLGEAPSHPELLDYLAIQFTEQEWSLKKMIRNIMLSNTYQMSTYTQVANEEHDPTNQLFHRFNVRRLSGEAIRDTILQLSGDLDLKMYGPSVAIHLTPFMQGRGRPANSGPLNGLGRRSVYIEVRRNFLSPMMLAFDTPIPFNTIGRRSESNVPSQALILMNSPFVVDQARKWADKLIQEHAGIEDRIFAIYQQAFAREPAAEELQQALAFLQMQADELQVSADDIATNVDLWADYCHVIFNVKEFIFYK